jgi:hypothetical protein
MSEPWFKPRRYGYGATPINWKGWAVSLAYPVVAIFIPVALAVVAPGNDASFHFALVLVWALLVSIAFNWFMRKKTNASWRWRWGDDE